MRVLVILILFIYTKNVYGWWWSSGNAEDVQCEYDYQEKLKSISESLFSEVMTLEQKKLADAEGIYIYTFVISMRFV